MSINYHSTLSGRQIRVLVLEPGLREDIIFTSLKTVDLDDHSTSYDALSYCWDRQKPSRPIRCEGVDCLVTQNVCDALSALRSADRAIVLWIDQVCINQADTKERNQQVVMMADIYRRASKVTIWLGREDEHTATAFNLLTVFAQVGKTALYTGQDISAANSEQQQQPLRLERSATDPDPPSVVLVDSLDHDLALLPTPGSTEWKNFVSGLSRSWFGRMWTFQEAVLGSPSTEFRCGRFSIPIDTFCSAANVLFDGGYTRSMEAADPGFIAFWIVDTIRRLRTLSQKSEQSTTLPLLLGSTRRLRCKDPHDKVYALLGTCKPSYLPWLKVDYNLSLTQLYGTVVKTSILVDQDLGMLNLVERWDNAPAGRPSWVPNLRDPRSLYGFDLGWREETGARCYFACGESVPAPLSLFADPSCLDLRGLRFRKITRILPFEPDVTPYANWDSWQERFRLATERLNIAWCASPSISGTEASPMLTGDYLRRSPRNPDEMHTTEDILAAVLQRVVTADAYPRRDKQRQPDHVIKASFPAFCTWRDQCSESDIPLDVLLEHTWFEQSVMRNRRLCIAGDEPNDAFLCLVSLDTKVGDWTCVLFGGDVPFVLREKEDSSPQTLLAAGPVQPRNHWEFLGECFVEGIMDGEALDGKTEDDFETFVLV